VLARIRSTYFAGWLLHVAPMIPQELLLWTLSLTGRHAPIARQDSATVVAGVLKNPESHRNKAYLLVGPVETTPTEIARILSQVSDK
jgi:uncharacterized protein YbjT (DUF2867 family)